MIYVMIGSEADMTVHKTADMIIHKCINASIVIETFFC